MKKKEILIVVFAALAFSACSYEEMAGGLFPKEESEFAKDYLQQIRGGDFEYVRSHTDPELIGQITDEKLLEIAEYFPSGDLLSTEIVGWQVNIVNGTWTGKFSFEFEFSEGWAVANAALKRAGDRTTVVGFNVHRTPTSQRELNAFSNVSPTPLHILMFAATIVIPIFMIFTCIMVYRTPIASRKWPWYLLSIGGVGAVYFNWTTGVVNYQILTVQLLGAGAAAAGPHAPWILEFTLPIGALVFWIKRRQLIERSKDTQQQGADIGDTRD